ncbi:pirin family protein [Isoalcanivorax beigongshangi]|uniref:Pirin family protein n=1 Tax=Isoalcanivorax beigongshangi TaxID=3238810 RepID=A0ABV4AG65_9GAMM
MKALRSIHSAPAPHWVGNGFPVRTLFSYQADAEAISPFLLLDHAGPLDFPPQTPPRGVGVHPHRGFETVTLVYDGDVAHRDSSGGGGLIGAGDVQWMTAGAGILHDEFHGPQLSDHGGRFEMVQLWVNLPRAAKLTTPRYQALRAADIPLQQLDPLGSTLRVIAGNAGGAYGPARTHSPLALYDMQLIAGARPQLALPAGWTTLAVLLRGAVRVQGTLLTDGQVAQLGRAGEQLLLQADQDSRLLVLSGAPLNEPVAGRGPFVMNHASELDQAELDLRQGRFGRWPPRSPQGSTGVGKDALPPLTPNEVSP